MRARFANGADVDAICRACAEGYRDTYADLLMPGQIEAMIADFYVPDRVRGEIGPSLPHWSGWIVADDQDGALACAGGGGMTGAALAELYVIYADPHRRRRRAGTAVLELLSEQQRAAGATAQDVAVNPGNELGLAFYRKHGFEPIGEREPFHEAQPVRSLVLRRAL